MRSYKFPNDKCETNVGAKKQEVKNWGRGAGREEMVRGERRSL